MFADDSFDCPICLERPIAPVVTRCGHVFCWSCILRHASFSSRVLPTCPLCSVNVRVEICKPVKLLKTLPRAPGSTVEMTLLCRKRASDVAFPASRWKSFSERMAVEEARGELALPNREVDGGAACIFSHYSLSSDVQRVARRQLRELRAFEKQCTSEGDEESLVFIRQAISLASKSLEEHGGTEDSDDGDEKDIDVPDTVRAVGMPPSTGDGTEDVMFYQASNGEPVFLDSLDMKMLIKNASRHGGKLRTKIRATVLECTDSIAKYDTRKRIRRTAFLSMGTSFSILELELKNLVDPSVYNQFLPHINARETNRRKQEALRREEELLADKPLSMSLTLSDYLVLPAPVRPPEMSEESFPSLEPTMSSPSLSPPPSASPVSAAAQVERKRSYAEVARAAAASSQPLSLSEESQFPSLSSSAGSASSRSPVMWGPRAIKATPAVLTLAEPAAPSSTAKEEQKKKPAPAEVKKSARSEVVASQTVKSTEIEEESSEEMEGGHMVMITPKKGPQKSSSRRRKNNK